MKAAVGVLLVAVLAFAAGYGLARSTVPRAELEGLRAELAALRAEVEAGGGDRAPEARTARQATAEPQQVVDVDVDGAPVRGPEDAPVTIVEFSDFQCPYCARVRPTLERLREEYEDDVRLVFKHLPLSFHPNALPAAKAATAAGRQGSFWEMHDLLFESPQGLTEEAFLEHARTLGLDVARFEADFRSEEVARAVADDVRQARALGVRGTPGFFINGRFLSGAQPYETFRARVDAALEEAS